MIKSFAELELKLSHQKPVKICVAGAYDKDLLSAIQVAEAKGYIEVILVSEQNVDELAKEVNLVNYQTVSPEEGRNMAEEAVYLVRENKADVLMKGTVDTTTYMRAILNKEHGLRKNGLVCAFGAFEVDSYHKLIFGADSGINVAPNLEQKKEILQNALGVLRCLGYDTPNVAFLAGSEVVNEKVSATFDAHNLVQAVNAGEFGSCIAEGPMALDVIFSKEAAEHKKIDSKVSENVDLIIYPNMETGNALAKSWLHFCKAKWGGLVLGCTKPVILSSRSDTAEVKINSIILGCLSAQNHIS